MTASALTVHPCDRGADQEQRLAAPTQHHRGHAASPGKDENSEFEVWFLLAEYHSHTILKSKDCK